MIRRGSPIFDDPETRPEGARPWNDRHTGWRFECPECGWESPVMKHKLGAQRHEHEHDCDKEN